MSSTTKARAGRDWTLLVVGTLARITLGVVVALMVWSGAPAVIGWHPTTVMSGSMAPRIVSGDVVVSRPVDDPSSLVPGRVLVVADPDHPGRLRLHRLVRTTETGALVLRGDANPQEDSSTVAISDVQGMAALRVPYAGVPVLLARTGHYLGLLALLAGLLTLVAVTAWDRRASGERPQVEAGEDDGHDPDDRGGPSGPSRLWRTARGSRWRRLRARSGVGPLALVVTVLLAPPASAAYSKTASDVGNTFSAQDFYTCSGAVLSDSPYLYYRFDETGITTIAADSSGNGRTGVYTGGLDKSAGRACARDTGTAVTLNGSTGYVGAGLLTGAAAASNVFTIEIWFRTTTGGGKLIGFSNTRTGSASSYDRHLYLTNAGNVVFGVYPGAVQTVVSPATYLDGQWHQAAATLSPAGMQLYVDGALVDSNAAVRTAQDYNGYWRVGYDNLSGWGSTQPTHFYFTGTLDDAAVYTTALSADRIAQHHLAGR